MRLVYKIKKAADTSVLCRSGKTAVKAVLCAFVICFVFSMTAFDAQSRDISHRVLRLHILANSDSVDDQRVKLRVRDRVQLLCADLYPEGCTRQQARRILEDKLPEIVAQAQSVVDEQGCSERVHGEIVNMYFTNRVYNDITLPAGNYDALRLTIGSGEGHNWWCVMFPPICVSAASGDISDVLTDNECALVKSDDIEYRFKLYELYEDLASRFS